MRTKHCKNCNRCVATYDHHCPWIGNCVAEKNRRFFFYFLICQLGESIWATYYLSMCFESAADISEWLKQSYLQLIGIIISSFFILMVGSLVFIHLYLASRNLTTWEFLSWSKISYMKIWPKQYGSPFSQNKSTLFNLHLYFCPQNN